MISKLFFLILLISYCYTQNEHADYPESHHSESLTPPEAPEAYDYFVNVPVRELHERFFRLFYDLLLRKGIFFSGNPERKQKSFNFKTPNELKRILDVKLDYENPADHEKILNIIEKILDYSPHASHPYYLHKTYSGLDPYGLMADMIIPPMNAITLVYMSAPVYTLMEFELIKNFRKLIGYPENEMGIGGIGTTYPNGLATQMALQNKFPNFKQAGFAGNGFPKVAIFASANCHPNYYKTVALQGIGTESIITVETDLKGRMIPKALDEEITKAKAKGMIPIMVIATSGTSLGLLDPIEEIAKVAAERDIWFHVDGDCGGSLLFSQTRRKDLKGSHLSDSFSWMPHCLLHSPIETGFIFTKKKDFLLKAFSMADPAVFKTTILYNTSYDLGDATIQTARRPDVFKIWLMWKVKGAKGLGAHIDHSYQLMNFTLQEMKERTSLKPIYKVFDLPIVSFNHIPKDIGKMNFKEYRELLNDHTEDLYNRILLEGKITISLTKARDENTFHYLTMNVANSAMTNEDIVYILDTIEFYGSNFQGTIPKLPPIPEYPDYVSSPIDYMHKNLFNYTFNLLIDKGLFFETERNVTAYDFKTPENLLDSFNLRLKNTGHGKPEQVKKMLRDVIRFTGHQAHPYWLYQLMAGLDPYGIVASNLISCLQTSMRTYEDSPPFSLIEEELFKNVRKLIGYKPDEGETLAFSGGSTANIHGVILAKYYKFQTVPTSGNVGIRKKLVYFTSKGAHYSQVKGAIFTGLGLENAIRVETDHAGRIIPAELDKAIQKAIDEGASPFMVGITAGTTVFGAIDPIEEVAVVCKKYDVWLHVDGAFAGSLIFSDKYRHRLKGIDKADSFTFNPAKMLAVPHFSTVFSTRHNGINAQALGKTTKKPEHTNVTLLYDKAKWDTDDSYFQKVRSANAVKLWLVWKAKGQKGIGEHIDYIMDLALFAAEEIKKRDGFVLHDIPMATNVCFYYIPKRLRDQNQKSKQFIEEIYKIQYDIQARLTIRGIMIVAQREKTPTIYLKFVIMNSSVSKEDLMYLLNQVESVGELL